MKNLARTKPRDESISPLQVYLQQIDQTPLLSEAEERELAQRIARGDRAARDRMVRANLRLVVSLARRYCHRGIAIEDAISEGNLGLMHAVERFDPLMNVRFCTYASYWIKQSFTRAHVNTARTIRVPHHVVELVRKWKKAALQMEDELQRCPTVEEIAQRIGISVRRAKIVIHALQTNSYSLAETEGETPEHDCFIDKRCPAPDMAMMAAESHDRLCRQLESMSQREALVLQLRFGLDGAGARTLRETGAALGITKERARQIECCALEKLAVVA